MTRKERLQALCDHFYLEPSDEGPWANSADEDVSEYLFGDKRVGQYAAVTTSGGDSGGIHYIYPAFDDLAGAIAQTTTNVGDSMYAEYPVAVVDLDTGVTSRPTWHLLPFEQHAGETIPAT